MPILEIRNNCRSTDIAMQKYIPLILSLLLAGCVPFSQRTRIVLNSKSIEAFNNTEKTKAYPPPITIWVHGTKTVSPYIFHKLCFTPTGFIRAAQIDPNYQVHKGAQILSELDPQRFNTDHYYIFGWSGKLSFQERKKAAYDLYAHILRLIDSYQLLWGQKPIIRIITHSHGGNVALNLAAVQKPEDHVEIEELILLACPIQSETAFRAQDPMFKKIYSLFSTLDTIQVIDPQGLQKWDKESLPKDIKHTKHLLSDRCFTSNKKIKQIQIKMNGRGIMHVEFLVTKFLKTLPAILHTIDAGDEGDTRIKLVHIKT